MMKVVYYANEGKIQAAKDFRKAVEACIPSECLEVFGNGRAFAERICRIPRNIDVAVLLAQDNDQLSNLLVLKDFLADMRMILILPDRTHKTVMKGHLLSPNYTGYIDSSALDIAAVLNKMISKLNADGSVGGDGIISR